MFDRSEVVSVDLFGGGGSVVILGQRIEPLSTAQTSAPLAFKYWVRKLRHPECGVVLPLPFQMTVLEDVCSPDGAGFTAFAKGKPS